MSELSPKIDINPSVAGSQVVPQKLAGLYSYSFESALFTEGFGEADIQTLLTHNLQSSLVNAERWRFWGRRRPAPIRSAVLTRSATNSMAF